MPPSTRQVFLNVPFDRRYQRLFHALVFTVHDCGLTARCALESSDAAQVRIEKLYSIIGGCRFGIHDLSRTTLDVINRLPRFNMPLELGIFLGAKRFGDVTQKSKVALILDSVPYRYQKFCSDIAGQDVRSHGNSVAGAIAAARAWLRDNGPEAMIPGEIAIEKRYVQFGRELPRMSKRAELNASTLAFVEYRAMVAGWQAENPL